VLNLVVIGKQAFLRSWEGSLVGNLASVSILGPPNNRDGIGIVNN